MGGVNMDNKNLYVICQNDYPIGVVASKEKAIKYCKILQGKYEHLKKLTDPQGTYIGFRYFHYHLCHNGDSESFIENVLLEIFQGWDKEYIKSLIGGV
jgi:hypothetical protein